MKRHEILEDIDACLEAGRPLTPELEAQLDAHPGLRRAGQTLERVDRLLREELGRAAGRPAPALSERVLAQLDAPAPRRRVRHAAAWAALAAAGLLAVALLNAGPDGPPAADSVAPAELATAAVTPLSQWLDWSMPLTPERALLDEAERLAADTRKTAARLWSRMPLTSLLAREER